MSKTWFHPNRPNVPQPPYNLTPDVAPLRPSSRSRANSGAVSPASVEMRREPEPEVPKRPSAYASPHHNSYITEGGTRPASPQTEPLPPVPGNTDSTQSGGGLRRMTAEERAAYIREVDGRQASRRAAVGSSGATEGQGGGRDGGLRPLQLAQSSLQVRQPEAPVDAPTASAPSGQADTPPTDDAALRDYLNAYYPDAGNDPVGDAQLPEAHTASSSSAMMPEDDQLATAMATGSTGSTYAETAHPPEGWRKPATAIYNPDGTVASHGRQASVTVTPAAPGAAVGPVVYDAANNALVEVFSNGQVVARISLPYPGAR